MYIFYFNIIFFSYTSPPFISETHFKVLQTLQPRQPPVPKVPTLFLWVTFYSQQGRPWLTRGPVRGMEWGPPRSVCDRVTGGGGGGGGSGGGEWGGGGVGFRSSRGAGPGATAPVAPPKGRPWLSDTEQVMEHFP